MFEEAAKVADMLHHPAKGCQAHGQPEVRQMLQWLRNELDEIEEELNKETIDENALAGEISDAHWVLYCFSRALGYSPDIINLTVEKMKKRHDWLFDGSNLILSRQQAARRYMENKAKERGI